jgi:alkylhydroperoxidase family enzyme
LKGDTAMARITLIEPDEIPALHEFAEKIRSGRRGAILNVYKALVHSPGLAETWFHHINAVRWGTELDGRLREILIIRIGHLTGAAYILRQHVPKLAEAEGLSPDECAALGAWRDAKIFSDCECAALAFADAMTEDIAVPDAVFEPLRDHFTERQIVELSVLIASYNMHARVLGALDVDLEAD